MDQDADPFFLPYWRFKGVRYTCTEKGVDSRFLDLSALALNSLPGIPFSLGFRSQALTLKLITPDTPGRFIRPLPFKTVMAAQEKKQKKEAPGFTEDIGEAVSLIYAPFYFKDDKLMDGVMNQPVTLPPDHPGLFTDTDLCRPASETQFIAGICPGCGWDLEGDGESMVLVCKNCHNLWRAKGRELEKIRYGSAGPGRTDDVMVPFWKIEADISHLPVASYADLVRMGNLPKAIQPEWETRSISFWVPAFKLQPKIFLRLITGFSAAQPHPPLTRVIHKNHHLPVTLPLSEAVQSVRLALASLVRPLPDHLSDLVRTTVTPRGGTLALLPFRSQPHDYVFTDLNLAIPKTNLALSGNL